MEGGFFTKNSAVPRERGDAFKNIPSGPLLLFKRLLFISNWSFSSGKGIARGFEQMVKDKHE